MTTLAPTGWIASWLRRSIVLAVSVKVVGLIVLFDWSGHALQPFDLVKSVWSRAFEWILVALILSAIVFWGTAVIPRTRLHLAVALLVIATVASALFAADPYTAAFGTRGRYLGLSFVVDMAILYLAVAIAFRKLSDWAVLFSAVGAGVAASLVYAWIQYEGLDPFAWTGSSFTRPFSTIGNANTYGHLLSVALGGSICGAVLLSGRGRLPLRVLCGLFAIAILVVSGVVATRGTLLGYLAAAVSVPSLFLIVRGVSRRNLAGVGIGFVVCAIALAMLLVVSPLGARVVATLNGLATLQDRVLVWQGSAEAFLSRPLTGFGPDSLAVAWAHFRPAGLILIEGPGTTADSAHDWILQAAATTGVIGLGALLLAIFVFGRSLATVGLRRAQLPAAVLLATFTGYWAHALVSVGTIGVDWVPWVAYGAAVSFIASDRDRNPRPILLRPSLRPALTVAALLVALALGAVGLRALDANREAARAREAADLRQGATAVEHGLQAVALDSGRADYWNELGRGYFAASRWADAVRGFDQAIQRAPWDATYRSNLARALAQMALTGDGSRGGPDAAIAAAREATTIDPNEPLTHIALSQIAAALGRPDLSLAAAAEAILLYPQDASYDQLASSAAAKASDMAAARGALEKALGAKESVKLRIALANVALRQGDRSAALDNARRVLAVEPANADARAIVQAAGG